MIKPPIPQKGFRQVSILWIKSIFNKCYLIQQSRRCGRIGDQCGFNGEKILKIV